MRGFEHRVCGRNIVAVTALLLLLRCNQRVENAMPSTTESLASVSECQSLLRSGQERTAAIGDATDRERHAAALRARLEAFDRLAKNPATLPELAAHCKELASGESE